MADSRDLSDAQWALIEPLMPSRNTSGSRPFRDHRPLVDGIIYRYRTGCPWRDVPKRYGAWRAVWRRHSQLSARGIWDRILVRLLAQADAAGELHWRVSVDSTSARVHQHAATLSRQVALSLRATQGAGSNCTGPPAEPLTTRSDAPAVA